MNTGLNCDEIPVPNEENLGNNLAGRFMPIRDMQIPGTLLVLLKSIIQANDEEMVSVVNLAVVEHVLMPKQPKVLIQQEHLQLAANPGEFGEYPWGRASFNALCSSMHSLSMKLSSKTLIGYDIGGFIYPLLAWAYEVIPALVDQEFTTRNNDVSYPRMFKWTYNNNPDYDDLVDKIFGNGEVWYNYIVNYCKLLILVNTY